MQGNIVKSLVSGRLLNRFATSSDINAPRLTLGDVLIPVTDVQPLLSKSKGQSTTGTGTARDDTYTVPAGKTWVLKNALAIRANAALMSMRLNLAGGTQYFINYSTATDTVLQVTGLSIRMLPGDAIIIGFGTGTSGSLDTVIVYEEEDYY